MYTGLLLFVVYFVMFIVFFTCGILKNDVCNNNDDYDKGKCSYQNNTTKKRIHSSAQWYFFKVMQR